MTPAATSMPATTGSTFDGGGFLADGIGLADFEGERVPVRVDVLAVKGPIPVLTPTRPPPT